MEESKARKPTWTRARVLAFAVGAALVLLGASAWRTFVDDTALRLVFESPYQGRCKQIVTRSAIDRSVELGTRFLLVHQKPEGNFDYEYDWREKRYSSDDNEVRQAGALWGLALLYRDHPTAELGAAVERGLAFFEKHARAAGGARCIAYPGRAEPGIGTVALVALSYIEYLATPGAAIAPPLRAMHEQRLAGYLAELQAGANPDGLFFGVYDAATCAPRGAPSPYSDGEALLALIKAAKYLGHGELRPLALRTADAGHRLNIEQAREDEDDSDVTKGYYQWSSMAFYELATSGWPDTDRFAPWVLDLADWQIDVHKTLTRRRNTGYAYEGLIPAYDLARRRGDATRAAKYRCVIDLGLGRLLSWQVGGPMASSYTAAVDAGDRAAVGGVQNAKDEPALRIDVTQHQLHALLYARALVY